MHRYKFPGSAPPSAAYEPLEALDTQLTPLSPSSRPLALQPRFGVGFKRAHVCVQSDSFMQVLICPPPPNHVTDLTVVLMRFWWNSGPSLPCLWGCEGFRDPPTSQWEAVSTHYISRVFRSRHTWTAKLLECWVLLWIGHGFDRREGIFSETLQKPGGTWLLSLSSSSSSAHRIVLEARWAWSCCL